MDLGQALLQITALYQQRWELEFPSMKWSLPVGPLPLGCSLDSAPARSSRRHRARHGLRASAAPGGGFTTKGSYSRRK
jgi:hypothetical protein